VQLGRVDDAMDGTSAMMGMPALATILASASVSARRGTATRTSSQPASTSRLICLTQRATFVVGTFVIDCTTTGAELPSRTRPT